MVPSPLYPSFASAQTVFAAGARCRPPSGAAGDAPFPERSPLPAKRTRDDGCGPGGVGKRVRLPPRSSGLERCSGSQRGSRLPNFPSSNAAAAAAPSAHPAARKVLGRQCLLDPPQGRSRAQRGGVEAGQRGAGRGTRGGAGAGCGAGRGAGPRRRRGPAARGRALASGLSLEIWSPSLGSLSASGPADSAARLLHRPSRRITRQLLPASRPAHDHPVPFGSARPPQVL